MGICFNEIIKIMTRLTGLMLVISLLSCSNSSSDAVLPLYSVGGTVTGLQGSVTLQNNAAETLTLNSSGDFTFNGKLSVGTSYNVGILAQPDGQTCTVSNESGIIVNADVNNIMVACTDIISLSGSYQAAALLQVDSDINDPTAVANISNDTVLESQSIPTFATVHGFATKYGTGRSLEGDRFAYSEDAYDFYRVELQRNQTLRLQVVDYAGVDVFRGDLDLVLFDLALDLVGTSSLTGEYESITVPADGEYYILVYAYSGSSKYTLTLDTVLPLAVNRQQSVDFRAGEAIVQFKQGAAVNSFSASHQSMRLSHQKTMRAARARFDIPRTNRSSAFGSKTSLSFEQELESKNPDSYQKYKTLQQIKQLNQRDDVNFAEPNYIYRPLRVPDDTFYSFQWHYPAINLPQAWDITTGSPDVIVAVIDTGVFLGHPEFAGQLVSGYDFISGITNAADGDGIDADPDDPGDSTILNNSSWHGTHVAATVAASSDDASGVAGIAWQAKIMPLRVLGTQGGTDYDIIQAIRFAAGLSNDSGTTPAQKADIINLSLGGTGYSTAAQNAYNEVRSAGVIVVAAAGNESTSSFSYPASYDGVVSVSATDFANNRAPYSNFGSKIDVAAPGGNQAADLNNDGYGDGVLSALVDDSSGIRQPSYNYYQGTSMATPHVAGVFALMRSEYPALSPDEVDNLLVSGAITTDLGATGRDDIYGHGLLDALKAVQMAQALENGGTLPAQPALIVATPSQLALGGNNGAILVMSNEGDDPATITSVTDDADWLSVTEGVVDEYRLGEYEVSIDRTGLSDSSYLGNITFNLSTGSSLQVQVTMDVGLVDKIGNVATIYLFLIDENFEVVDQVTAIDSGGGVFDYSFPDVAAGNYQIIGGSDIDNDLFVCQMAEACGGYPTVNALSTIEVIDADITGLDFIVDILSNFGSRNLLTDLNIGSSGVKRMEVQMTGKKRLSR